MSELITERESTEFGGDIVTLRLNRPEAMNSFSRTLVERLEEIVEDLYADRAARVLLITGAGRAFSAGADLKERATMAPEEVRRFLRRVGLLFRAVEALPIPTVAAINGFALGGGLELALCCDLRLAAESAVLGLTETSLGIIPGAGGTQRLTRIAGVARAKEMILTAGKFPAARALEFGVVNSVVPDAALMEDALKLAREMARNAPVALAQGKFAVDRGHDVDLETGLRIERMAYEVTIPTKDRLEALNAFKEKRPPVFRGE